LQVIVYGATMQRMAWTDERLEERFDRIDDRFEQVDRRFDQVDRRFDEAEEHNRRRFDSIEVQLSEVRQGLASLNMTISRGSFALLVGLISLAIALFIKGG
jgi:flagellar capping protein FliD